MKGSVVDVLHCLSHNLGSVCSSGNNSFLDAWALADCAFFSFCCNRGTDGSRTFLPCIQNGAEPSRRCLVGESPLLASSFARGLSDSVNLKRSSSCSFVCEIKKEPTVSFQNDWLRWQQKTAGSICYCLPSLHCIQLLLGFVSIFKGKKPFLHLRI